MKRFKVVGADKDSGNDVSMTLLAKNQAGAEQEAHERGVLVASITALPDAESDSIELIDESGDPAVGKNHGTHGTHGHAAITLSANSPSDTAHTGDGHMPVAHPVEAAMEYHIVMNQALYLLEVAVNKYIKEGWEPQGGLTIGISNNAMQYFQTLVRRKK